MPTAVLDHRLFVTLPPVDIEEANESALGSSGVVSHVANQLLAFDTLLIPTMDFAIALRLADWMGVDVLAHLLQSGAVRFVRRTAMLTYVGNGNGINLAQIQETPAAPFSPSQRAMWGSLEEALQSRFEVYGVNSDTRDALFPLIVAATTEYQPTSSETFIEQVEHQSYRDILASESLKAAVSGFDGPLTNYGPIDLKRLPSVAPDQAQVHAFDPPTNAAQVILEVAEANLQLLMAAEHRVSDLYTRAPTDVVLAQRLKDAGAPSAKAEGLVRVVDLAGVPDIGLSLERGQLGFGDLVELRESPAGRQFREWLAALDPTDPRDVERAVVDDLLATSRIASSEARAIRLAATVGLGLVNPLAGVAASVADNLVAERLLEGWRPRVFLKRLKQLLEDSTAT